MIKLYLLCFIFVFPLSSNQFNAQNIIDLYSEKSDSYSAYTTKWSMHVLYVNNKERLIYQNFETLNVFIDELEKYLIIFNLYYESLGKVDSKRYKRIISGTIEFDIELYNVQKELVLHYLAQTELNDVKEKVLLCLKNYDNIIKYLKIAKTNL